MEWSRRGAYRFILHLAIDLADIDGCVVREKKFWEEKVKWSIISFLYFTACYVKITLCFSAGLFAMYLVALALMFTKAVGT